MTVAIQPKALKAQNSPTLWAVVVFDILLLMMITMGAAALSDLSISRALLARASFVGFAPVIVLLLNPLVPSGIKAIFIFWRVKLVLPGHRAFSKHALHDARIDLAKLKKNVGVFPVDQKEQNTKWYALFKKVENDPAVQQVHKQFLLLRDLAMLSILLLACSALAAWVGLIPASTFAAVAGLFGVQYLLAALGARFQGNGLVCSVLALHSVKRRV